MAIATLTSKGQITVPKQVRDDLALSAGAQISFVRSEDGSSYRVERLGRPVKRLARILQYDGPPKTLEEMDQGIGLAVSESYV